MVLPLFLHMKLREGELHVRESMDLNSEHRVWRSRGDNRHQETDSQWRKHFCWNPAGFVGFRVSRGDALYTEEMCYVMGEGWGRLNWMNSLGSLLNERLYHLLKGSLEMEWPFGIITRTRGCYCHLAGQNAKCLCSVGKSCVLKNRTTHMPRVPQWETGRARIGRKVI